MNRLFYGDNLDILRTHIKNNSVDLIYIDPPFNSKRNYNMIWDEATAQTEAFKDTWSLRSIADEEALIFEKDPQRYNVIHNPIESYAKLLKNNDHEMYAYLVNIGIRLVELHRVLKVKGSFYLHCDPTASHYLKILCDAIFGRNNFRNEIVWCYTGPSGARYNFPNKHDIIFRYSKSDDWVFNRDEIRIPYKELHSDKGKNAKIWGAKGVLQDDSIRKQYEEKGKVPEDYWTDIPSGGHISPKERLGYPTQKPLALLERIISASSNKDDIVLDAYCGCGTTVAAAQNLGRKWIGIDITYISIDLIKQRLIDSYYLNISGGSLKQANKLFNKNVSVFGIPRGLEGAKALRAPTKRDRVRKEFEKWAVFTFGGVFFEKRGADGGIDGYCYIVDQGVDGRIERLRVYIQVKSGKVGVSDIRDFAHVIEREEAPMGIFITLESPTRNMVEETQQLPQYVNKLTGRKYPRICIVTVEELIKDELPKLPLSRVTKQAGRSGARIETEDMLD